MGGRLSTAGLLQMATADDQKVNRAVARWRLLLEQFHRLQQILGPFFLLKFAREEEAEGALRDPPALAQGLALVALLCGLGGEAGVVDEVGRRDQSILRHAIASVPAGIRLAHRQPHRHAPEEDSVDPVEQPGARSDAIGIHPQDHRNP